MILLKKKRYSSNNPNPILGLYYFIICLCIIFLSVGFSAFSTDLSIEGISATLRVQKDIRVTGNNIKSVSEGTIVSYTEYNVKDTFHGITLPSKDSYAIFDIIILNLGNVEMAIKSISGLPEGLKYEIVNDDYISEGYNSYHEREMLCDDKETDKCKLGSESHILIKISYENEEAFNNAETITFGINLNYEFIRHFKITYNELALTLLSENYPTNAIQGDNVSISINHNNIKYVSITSTDEEGEKVLVRNVDYFLENNVLTIKNINGNIKVNVNEKIIYNISYSDSTLSLLGENYPTTVVDGDDVSIGINYSDISRLEISSTSGDVKKVLLANRDYTLVSNLLIIKNIDGNIDINVNNNYHYNDDAGISISTEFINNNKREVEVTLNGELKNTFYIRVAPNDVKVFTDVTNMCAGYFANKYAKGSDMYMSYKYISGSAIKPSYGKSFTVKYRQAKNDCTGINSFPELVTNTSAIKDRFDIYDTNAVSRGDLTADASDLISVYATGDWTFDNFKFVVKYGPGSELDN